MLQIQIICSWPTNLRIKNNRVFEVNNGFITIRFEEGFLTG